MGPGYTGVAVTQAVVSGAAPGVCIRGLEIRTDEWNSSAEMEKPHQGLEEEERRRQGRKPEGMGFGKCLNL